METDSKRPDQPSFAISSSLEITFSRYMAHSIYQALKYLMTNSSLCLSSRRLLIVLGFNDTSTLVGHFVSSPREREKRDRRDSRRDEREDKAMFFDYTHTWYLPRRFNQRVINEESNERGIGNDDKYAYTSVRLDLCIFKYVFFWWKHKHKCSVIVDIRIASGRVTEECFWIIQKGKLTPKIMWRSSE